MRLCVDGVLLPRGVSGSLAASTLIVSLLGARRRQYTCCCKLCCEIEPKVFAGGLKMFKSCAELRRTAVWGNNSVFILYLYKLKVQLILILIFVWNIHLNPLSSAVVSIYSVKKKWCLVSVSWVGVPVCFEPLITNWSRHQQHFFSVCIDYTGYT